MAKVIPKNDLLKGITSVRCNNSKPNQLVNGPGNTGKKEPAIPNRASKKPINSKKISINYFIFKTIELKNCYKFLTKKLV